MVEFTLSGLLPLHNVSPQNMGMVVKYPQNSTFMGLSRLSLFVRIQTGRAYGGQEMTQQTIPFLRIEKLVKGKVEGHDVWEKIPLHTRTVIGRSSNDDGTKPLDVKIVGDDRISRRQAAISLNPGEARFMISDLGSINGTFLNGELLEKDKPYPLKDNDLISLAKVNGQSRVVFRFRNSEGTIPAWVEEEPGKPVAKEGLFINLAARRVYVNGKEIPLTRKEFQILEVLYDNRGNPCTTDDISYHVWGRDGATPELIAQHIMRLRRSIELDPYKPRYIITPPGRQGCYQLVC